MKESPSLSLKEKTILSNYGPKHDADPNPESKPSLHFERKMQGYKNIKHPEKDPENSQNNTTIAKNENALIHCKDHQKNFLHINIDCKSLKNYRIQGRKITRTGQFGGQLLGSVPFSIKNCFSFKIVHCPNKMIKFGAIDSR